MTAQAKGFSTFGAAYMAFECPFERFRGYHDPWNGFIGGGLCGGVIAFMGHNSLKGSIFAGVSCGCFCMLIDHVMGH
jgi:hypothetical protein